MGKKSKSNKVKALPPTVAAGKKAQCGSCLALIKDASKSHHCDGCEFLACWRCAKKYFQTCPNGSGCLNQMSRCDACISGLTLRLAFEASYGKIEVKDIHNPLLFDQFKKFALSVDASDKVKPFLSCEKEGCETHECVQCYNSNSRSIIHCLQCKKVRCISCVGNSLPDPSLLCLAPEDLGAETYSTMLRAMADDYMSRCRSCNGVYCLGCVRVSEFFRQDGFECQNCYYSSKPCTNPNCPNELGVPTKRCGDCRRSRYCSKECQVAMYPEHEKKCKKIMEKRAEREAEVESTKELMRMVAEACKRDVSKMAESNPEQAMALQEQTKEIIESLEEACKHRPRVPKEEREKALFIMSAAKKFEERGDECASEHNEIMDLLRNYLNGSDLRDEMAKGVR